MPGSILERPTYAAVHHGLADIDNDDTGDTPIPGVTLTLLNGDGTVYDSDPNTAGIQVLTATTDANGRGDNTGAATHRFER